MLTDVALFPSVEGKKAIAVVDSVRVGLWAVVDSPLVVIFNFDGGFLAVTVVFVILPTLQDLQHMR